MTPITTTLNGKRIAFVKVDPASVDFRVVRVNKQGLPDQLWYKVDRKGFYTTNQRCELIPAGMQFIGLSNSLTPEQKAEIVGYDLHDIPQMTDFGYYEDKDAEGHINAADFNEPDGEAKFHAAVTAFLKEINDKFTSLMQSLGLFHDNPLLEPDINDAKYRKSRRDRPFKYTLFQKHKAAWQAAENLIGVWAVCLDKEGENGEK